MQQTAFLSHGQDILATHWKFNPNLLMPRKNPVPEKEIAVGMRLREAREGLMIPRTKLADQLGINVSRLNSYERGDSPLLASIGVESCKAMGINHFWLATGDEHFSEHGPWGLDDLEAPLARETFLSYFHRCLIKISPRISTDLENAADELLSEIEDSILIYRDILATCRKGNEDRIETILNKAAFIENASWLPLNVLRRIQKLYLLGKESERPNEQ